MLFMTSFTYGVFILVKENMTGTNLLMFSVALGRNLR